MTTSISIQALEKTYITSRRTVRAVAGVNLDISPGELFFLLGPSGCGKTTLLRMIAGFIDPTGGRIAFSGRDVTHMPPNRRNTGMVFQSYALWPHMTVAQNVAFGLSVRRVKADERDRRVREALEAVQLADFGARKPNELSGGQQQRVALARALVIRPDVLLLDEPLSNLDAKLRIELRAQIRAICKATGITSVYVTHDQKEALSMADRIAIMRAGQVEQVGEPRTLYRRPTSAFVAEFLGETNFLSAEVEQSGPEGSSLRTPAGVLRSSHAGAGGARVTLSIRPEALALLDAPAGGALEGRLVETCYLGEIAQHVVELPGGMRVKVAALNPGARSPEPGAQVRLRADPDDVVIVG